MGFRFVEVTGFPGELTTENLTGVVVHSDMKVTGSYESSNALLNQLQHNIQWGQKGNFVDVPTDCPQRDERLGWTGDAQAFCRTAAYNMDVSSFFTKWLKDVSADQKPGGEVLMSLTSKMQLLLSLQLAGAMSLLLHHGQCTLFMAT
jgi:alpha-L-rhamnosidase